MSATFFFPEDIVTIWGRRGCGKTSISRSVQKHPAFPRRVIFDLLHEYKARKGRHIVEGFDALARVLAATLSEDCFEIVVHFDIENDSHSEDLDRMLRLLYYRGSVCIVLEEVHNFASLNFCPNWLRKIVTMGRHRKIGMITTSQRPAEVHPLIRSQAHHFICGALDEPNDRKYLEKKLGEAAEKLESIKPTYFIWKNGPEIKFLRSSPQRD